MEYLVEIKKHVVLRFSDFERFQIQIVIFRYNIKKKKKKTAFLKKRQWTQILGVFNEMESTEIPAEAGQVVDTEQILFGIFETTGHAQGKREPTETT